MLAEVLITIAIIILFAVVGIIEFFVFKKNKKIEEDLIKREEDAKHKMYEISILNELSDKMGYSLNVQSVIETITKSLRDIIDYTAVSYMLFLPEKIIFRAYIEKPVSRSFINDVKAKMLEYASTLLKVDFKNTAVEETLWGSLAGEESNEQAMSFFNIPLTVSGKVVGLLNVSDKREGFYKEKEITAVNGITEQATGALTRLQRAIESENSKLNAMVSSMTDGVIMTDTDYRILVANPAARKAAGLESKTDLSVADFAQGLNGKFDLKDKIEESIRLDNVFLSEEIALGTNFFQIIVSPVADSWRKLGCVVVFRDITKEKELERIKEDFTSMIVHELRSPLDSIKKMAALMRVSEATKVKRAECFQMIYSSSSDMLELINNLLDIAKIEAGKFELMKQKSDIKKLIESRILFFDITAKDSKLKLASQFAKDLPDNVDFDPRTISQVLNNFLSNAIKFTKEGGSVMVQALFHKKDGSLEEQAKAAGISWFIKKDIADIPDSLVVAVTDSGIGIAQDQMGKLFNKFAQAKSTFVAKGGTGLGLAIAKSITESHGGVVGVESVEGKGTTFYFTLPVNN
jgi:two-component system, NtrC family, sensor histidine kinase KinB